MQQLKSYFPNLSEQQIGQFEQLGPLYTEWNAKINVISRKDIDNLYERHILHSLAIAHFIRFHSGAEVLDLGTGGGFPGIPLAIFFPQTKFFLMGLSNVETRQVRAEELKKMKFDFVVSRAVASIDQLMLWSQRLIKTEEQHAVPNGLIALKGGKVQEEVKLLPRGSYSEISPVSDYYSEAFFAEKYLVYVQR